jgi:hypothetical protein
MAVDDLDADGSMNQPGRPKVTAKWSHTAIVAANAI